jgi:hypothetical protein
MTTDQNIISGTLISAIGVFISVYSQRYELGNLSNIGPGFFPTILGILLFIFGLLIAIRSVKLLPRSINLDLKSLLCVTSGIFLFRFSFEPLGLFLSTILSVLIFMYPVDVKFYKKFLLGVIISIFNYFIFVVFLNVMI